MLDEELLFAEWDKYLIAIDLIEKFESSGRADFASLVKICKLLCRARLLRRNSDINGYFNYGMRRDIEKPTELVKRIDGEDLDSWNFKNFKAYFEFADKGAARKCFYWMYKIYTGRRKGSIRRFKRKDNIYMVWEFLIQRSFGNNLLRRCLDYRLRQFFNTGRKERGIFLTAAVDLSIEKDNLDWSPERLKAVPESDIEDIDKIFGKRKRLVFDDYVIDMHTSMGRKMGKNVLNFVGSGATVVDEDPQFLEEKWRETYTNGKLEAFAAKKSARKKKAMVRADRKVAEEKPSQEDKGGIRFVSGASFDKNKMKICMENTCGNKAMCFEHKGKVYKEGRKSMGYNRDYVCFDGLKHVFGLRPIGMCRILSDFRIRRVDKEQKSWVDNWEKVVVGEEEEQVVYCEMRKVGEGKAAIKRKSEIIANRTMLKDVAKIAIVRGIFRVSDFTLRNILFDTDDCLVSIDEGNIGKRASIVGGRNRWLVTELNKDRSIIAEVLDDVRKDAEDKMRLVRKSMLNWGFAEEQVNGVERNFERLKVDLRAEGVLL